MKVIFHLSASRWAAWRQEYGDHPDVLWRDLKQKFAKAALDKFDLQEERRRSDGDGQHRSAGTHHGPRRWEPRYRDAEGFQARFKHRTRMGF